MYNYIIIKKFYGQANLLTFWFVYDSERRLKRVFDRYIALYGKRLYGLCVNLCGGAFDPDDLYQETWLKALGKIHRYDESKPFEPWITAICVNIYRDMLRKHKNNLFPFGAQRYTFFRN